MRISVGIAALVAVTGRARAQPAPVPVPQRPGYYSVFDLEQNKLSIGPIPDGATAGPGLAARNCKAQVANHVLTIERTNDPACMLLFTAQQPIDLGIDLLPKPPAGGAAGPAFAFPVLFDHGFAGITRVAYTEADARFDFQDTDVAGRIVYFSKKAQRWTKVDVTAGIGSGTPGDIADGTEVYFWPIQHDNHEIFVVTRVITKSAESPVPPPFDETCKDKVPASRWLTKLDAANATNSLEVIDAQTIIEPNSFGAIVVRHAAVLQATFDATGTVKLEAAPIRDAIGQNGSDVNPREVRLTPPTAKLVCTVYQVAPRGAGSYTVTVNLVDPTKTAANQLSTRKLDVIVLQRYSGAFRVGVAGIIAAPDQKFEARTPFGSGQAEIARTAATPVELVFGYSVYFASLVGDRNGRSYFAADGKPVQDSHWGTFLGFGALSVTGTNNIDYLKSLHIGLEYEVSPYFAIAATGVFRRVDELAAGAQVGGPAPMTIPTQSKYVLGAAVVLNISPSFFRFANGAGK